MLAATNRDGYSATNVAAVIARAGVSRPTFYEYFADKDECFLAVHRDISRRLVRRVERSVGEDAPQLVLHSAARALVEFSQAEPVEAGFLLNDTMAGGPRALDERDRTFAEIEEIVERARVRMPPQTMSPDLPTGALLGAVQWLLVPRLRRRERTGAHFLGELNEWLDSYRRPASEHRWRTPEPGPPPPSRYTSELPSEPPPAIPRGRTRLSGEEIARNHRERIMYATAKVATEKGYPAATIADITETANVDRRVFYQYFRDKQQAFLAVHELGFQQTMAASASAFFSAGDWPERVWQGILAGAQFGATHPAIGHIGFVESHAVGAPAIQRFETTRQAFTIFLQEGNRYASVSRSGTAMEAIAAAIFEILYQQFRHGNVGELTCLSYPAAYIALAPFLGPAGADALVESKLP
jgi:AcrR family transcriptional regulator